jgi:hypothetical protein
MADIAEACPIFQGGATGIRRNAGGAWIPRTRPGAAFLARPHRSNSINTAEIAAGEI